LFLFAGTVVPAFVIGAFAYLAWRKPALAGGLLVAFTPFGAFAALLGSTNLDPASQVILGFVWFAGLPLVSGLMLLVAALVRSGVAAGLPPAHRGEAREIAQRTRSRSDKRR
jgi:O-antigen ligase